MYIRLMCLYWTRHNINTDSIYTYTMYTCVENKSTDIVCRSIGKEILLWTYIYTLGYQIVLKLIFQIGKEFLRYLLNFYAISHIALFPWFRCLGNYWTFCTLMYCIRIRKNIKEKLLLLFFTQIPLLRTTHVIQISGFKIKLFSSLSTRFVGWPEVETPNNFCLSRFSQVC